MRKPREEGRSTRSSASRPRGVTIQKKSPAAKVKPKVKAKPPTKKQNKDADRPMQVTFIRLKNTKSTKNIIQGGVTKQRNQQKKKTSAVVGALKEDLLKKLAENDNLSGVVNTLLGVAVVKKVIPRKKAKDEDAVQSTHEKSVIKEPSLKQQAKHKKESLVDTKADVTSPKETDKKLSKEVDKKVTSKVTKKSTPKEEKKPVVKEEKKTNKKINPKPIEKKLAKKTDKKITGKEVSNKPVVNVVKKVTRGSKASQPESRKKPQTKPKSKAVDEANLSVSKSAKNEKVLSIELNKKDSGVNKKDTESNKKDQENANKREKETSKKESEVSKRITDSERKKEATIKKDSDANKKDHDLNKKDMEGCMKENESSTKDEDSKKPKSVKDEDPKKPKSLVSSKNTKDEDTKKVKNVKEEEVKKPKKNLKKESIENSKSTDTKASTKKTNEKEKSKTPDKKESKKPPPRPSCKSKERISKESKSENIKEVKKKIVKRKPKTAKSELDCSAKISQILNAPKRHREASLNAIAKVHCLYENESRGVIMDILDKSEKLSKEDRKERNTAKSEKGPVVKEEDEEEVEEVPVRNLRTAPGLRSVGRHWDMLNASSSSSEDSSDSASDRKSVEVLPSSPPRVPEKKVKRRRKRSEVVMDLKDMVVKKRMASLNASAMMAATYSTDRRSNKSDDDSQRKDSDSRESSSTPEVVDVEETSDDEVILGGRKKALVILNQDTADLTITGVYVNSTTRSTRHEGFCSISGMQYRISSTSHTQTETAVSTETTVIHTEHGESSRTGGSDGGSSCKTYTPLGALSSMQPPGSPRYPPSPASSAFSAPAHHHPHHQDMHEVTTLDHLEPSLATPQYGYFQPAGPLISSSQLKAGPSQVEEMQGTSSSQAVTYTAYPPAPAAYLESPGYPHAYPKYPPPPPGYPTHHRRYFYPSLEAPYPSPYPPPHYYNTYTSPPQPPLPYRPGSYMEAQFQPCPCPMQSCPKNVLTGPLTGTSKGSESNSTVPPVGASRGPVQLNPVALSLPPEPSEAVNPPSPARGSAGLPPPASPALAQASWGTPPPPQSPGHLTSLDSQPRRKRRRTTSLSPPPSNTEKLSEPSDKLLRPIERMVQATEKYENMTSTPVDRFMPDRTLLCDRLIQPSDTIMQTNNRTVHPPETAHSLQSNNKSFNLLHSSESSPQNCNRFSQEKINDRLISNSEKVQLSSDRSVHHPEKIASAKTRSIHSCEKVIDRSIHPMEKSVLHSRPAHPCSDANAPTNDRTAFPSENNTQPCNWSHSQTDKILTGNRLTQPLQSERHPQPPYRIVQQSTDRSVKTSEKVMQTSDRAIYPERPSLPLERTAHERIPLANERPKSLDKCSSQDVCPRPNERLVSPAEELHNGLSHSEDDSLCIDSNEPSKRSLNLEDTVQTPNRRVSVSKRTPLPKKLSSPAEADTPPKRNTKSPERKVKKACVPVKNGRRKKEIDIKEEIIEEETPLVPCPQLKWSNGWSWRGESFTATVYIRDDRTEVRKCYPAMKHKEGDIIQPRDCILLKSAGSRKNLPFVAKVAALWENPDDGEMMVSLLWYYRPEHTEQGRQPHQPPDEVFASRHKDSNSVACIEDKCYVLTFNEYCRYMKRCRQVDTQRLGWTPVPESESGYPRASRMPPGRVSRDLIFFCRKVYDFRLSRILKNPC